MRNGRLRWAGQNKAKEIEEEKAPDEYIEKILEAGCWAVSGGNGRPWEFLVAKDKAKLAKLGGIHGEWRKTTYEIEMTRAEEMRPPAVSLLFRPHSRVYQ